MLSYHHIVLLQAKAADGSEAHYITSSTSYLRYYATALRSAREHAPSLLPVLVVLNDMPQDFVDWVEAQARGVEQHGGIAPPALLGSWWASVLPPNWCTICCTSPWACPKVPSSTACSPATHCVASALLYQQGGLVIHHELSFASRMEATNDPWLRENLTKQLMASYARLDVPAIMEKVGHEAGCTRGLRRCPAARLPCRTALLQCTRHGMLV